MTAEDIAAELITGDGMPAYLLDTGLRDLVMEWATAEAEVRQLRPAFDAALESYDGTAMARLSDPYCTAVRKAADALHKLGLTPLGRAEGYPQIPA